MEDFKGGNDFPVREYAGKTGVEDAHDAQDSTQRPGERTGVGQDFRGADPVELALADALARASVAGVWTVVERLAGELEARRTERLKGAGLADVVTLASARRDKRKTQATAIDPRQTDLFKK